MTQEPNLLRQLPGLTPDTRAFWRGGENGKLMIYRCFACSRYTHPPRPICVHCGSRNIVPSEVSGKGQVNTYTVNQQVWVPALKVPYVFAAIELVEQAGLYVLSNVIKCPPEQIRINMRVKVLFEHIEDIYLPLFEPDEEE